MKIVRKNLIIVLITLNFSALAQLSRLILNEVYVDYAVNGAYSKAVLYHGSYEGVDLYDRERGAFSPWGTCKKADKTIYINDLAEFKIQLKDNALGKWKGKAHISFIMQNTGTGTRAKIILR